MKPSARIASLLFVVVLASVFAVSAIGCSSERSSQQSADVMNNRVAGTYYSVTQKSGETKDYWCFVLNRDGTGIIDQAHKEFYEPKSDEPNIVWKIEGDTVTIDNHPDLKATEKRVLPVSFSFSGGGSERILTPVKPDSKKAWCFPFYANRKAAEDNVTKRS